MDVRRSSESTLSTTRTTVPGELLSEEDTSSGNSRLEDTESRDVGPPSRVESPSVRRNSDLWPTEEDGKSNSRLPREEPKPRLELEPLPSDESEMLSSEEER